MTGGVRVALDRHACPPRGELLYLALIAAASAVSTVLLWVARRLTR